jgi:micrococcal nuclease
MKFIAIAFGLFAMMFAYNSLPMEAPLSPGAIRPQEAASYMGQTVTVEGIAHVHVKSSVSFIDMGGDYPFQSFQAVIFGDSADAFGDLSRYDGKTVNVTGRIREYNGKPEITLDDPHRLKAR